MKQSEWNKWHELREMIDEAIHDAMFDAGFDVEGSENGDMPEWYTIYITEELDDVRVAVNGTHIEDDSFDPDAYPIVEYAYSYDEAVGVADMFFDPRQ